MTKKQLQQFKKDLSTRKTGNKTIMEIHGKDIIKNIKLLLKNNVYTGLKDKNGKKIKEGDFLTNKNKSIWGIVKYYPNMACFCLLGFHHSAYPFARMIYDGYNIENELEIKTRD